MNFNDLEKEGKVYIYRTHIRYLNEVEPDESFYSDRLWQWNPEKFDSAMKASGHFGQMFYHSLTDIEKFLQEYFDCPTLVLVSVEEIKNVSTGFPYWWFKIR